ncbi:MAG: GNAT family N-acetyltransferase [Pseudomonadota bacterium]
MTVSARAWDSQFFGKSIGRLDPLDLASVDETTLDSFAIVECKIPADQLHAIDLASERGFRLAETEVDFSSATRKLPFEPRLPVLASPDDAESVRDVARISFGVSRFRRPFFSTDDSSRLYEVWAEKAIHGAFDDACLIEKDDTELLGFVTLRSTGALVARIGLIAVSKNARGLGVGARLLAQARAWCLERGLETLSVATQGSNFRALNFYVGNGFHVAGLAYWYCRQCESTS